MVGVRTQSEQGAEHVRQRKCLWNSELANDHNDDVYSYTTFQAGVHEKIYTQPDEHWKNCAELTLVFQTDMTFLSQKKM